MKVIICGCGDVGSSIASYLFAEGHQVTIIDGDSEKLKKMESQMDVQAIHGPASSPEILDSARASDADLIIAVTPSDEVNMIICLQAARLFNIPLKIARVRSGYYSNQGYLPFFDDLHIDVVISPEKEVARTILRNLKTPGALDFLPLPNGTVFIGTRCMEDCDLERTKAILLNKKFEDFPVLTASIIRDNMLINVDDKTLFKAGDEVYFICDINNYDRVLEAFGHPTNRTNRVVIIGGGRVGFTLAKMMEIEGIASRLSIIEQKENKALYLAKHLSDALVIKGDAMDEAILEEAHIKNADAVISLTGEDEDNILLSLLAKQYGVKRTFSLINKGIYNPMLSHLGLDVIVNPNVSATSTILQHIRKGQVQSIYSLKPQLGDLMVFEALETSKVVGVPLKKIKKPKNVQICGVVRDGKLLDLKDTLEIKASDSVIILAPSGQFKAVEKLFSAGLFFF